MIYRKFGHTDVDVSQLVFGCMRFPLADPDDPSKIDEDHAARMLHYALEHGVNYFDTAYPYHREQSEPFVGRTLKEHRSDLFLATKMPMWKLESREDLDTYFNEQQERLQTNVIDMYLLHALGESHWKKIQELDILSYVDGLLKEGKIRFAGFSFHDELPLFKKIVDAYPWTFCLIHVNYVDTKYQAGLEGLRYAAGKGLAVEIMEPLRGGKLANRVPQEVLDIIKKTGRNQTPAQFALRWLYNMPEVNCVLSGMSTLEQVEENARFASEDHRGTLTERELDAYAEASAFYQSRTKVNCTQCGYCMPCPNHIPIAFILDLYNDVFMYDALEESQWAYSHFISPEGSAEHCKECGECEEKCPQKVPIMEALRDAHELLRPRKEARS
jgi:hypothetical protein